MANEAQIYIRGNFLIGRDITTRKQYFRISRPDVRHERDEFDVFSFKYSAPIPNSSQFNDIALQGSIDGIGRTKFAFLDIVDVNGVAYADADTLDNLLMDNLGGLDSTSGGVTSVNGQTGVVVLDADDIDDSSTTNKFVKKLYINLDSAESEVSRVFAAGRTTFTITHNFNTKDVYSTVIRLSNDRRVGWRIEATTVNTVEASRTGKVSDGDFRILLTT